jgi:hypothetical protein
MSGDYTNATASFLESPVLRPNSPEKKAASHRLDAVKSAVIT